MRVLVGRQAAAMVWCLAVLLPLPELAEGEENKEELREAYEAWFRSRYGTEEERPARDVLESRCREDMALHLAVLHTDAAFLEHYERVARLWRENATRESLPDLASAIETCYRIHTKQIRLRLPPISLVHHLDLRKELSYAWLETWWPDATPQERAEVLMESIRRDARLHLHENAVVKHAAGLGEDARNLFYETALNSPLNENSLTAIRGIMVYPAFRPTKQELRVMLKHKEKQIALAARSHVIDIMPWFTPDDPLPLETVLSDVKSKDPEWATESLHRLVQFLEHRRISRDVKHKLLDEVRDYLYAILRDFKAGTATLGADRDEAARFVAGAIAALYRVRRCEEDIQGRIPEFDPFMVWLEERAEAIGLTPTTMSCVKQLRERWEPRLEME